MKRGRVRRMKLRRVGHRPTRKRDVKHHEILNTNIVNKGAHQLHQMELTTIARDASNHSHSKRFSNKALIKGFKIQKVMKNNDADPTIVNVAVVVSKVDDDTVSAPDLSREFFRSYTDGRVRHFEDAADTPLQRMYTPLNSDRFEILHRWRRVLEGSGTVDAKRTYWVLDKYIPFNRVLRFDDTTGRPESGRTFLIFWLDAITRNKTTVSSGVSVAHQQRSIVFFTDIL